jgi:integrase
MAKRKKKETRDYGKYLTEIDGRDYAVVRLPLGNGKYKRKTKLLSSLGNGAKSEAIKWALDQLDQHRAGELEPSSPGMTFSDLAKWYKREFLVAPVYKDGKRLDGVRTYKAYRSMLDRLDAKFGLYKLDKITVDVLRRFKRERLKDVSIITVNRDFELLRTMFKKAKTRKWLKESPFDLGENLIEVALEGSRKSPLTLRIAKRLLARSRKSEQPLLHYLIFVCMFTGARPSEVYPFHGFKDEGIPREPLSWKNILEFDYKAIRLVSYKGRIRTERIVPTSAELEKALRKLHDETNPPSENDLVFPVKTIKRSWATLCRSVKCEGVWLRDFRHFYNSTILVNEKFNDAERLLLLGQTQLKTNLRYAYLDESFVEKYRAVTSEVIEVKSDNN